MITLFTTAKPFKGHSAMIQRNALRSWRLLHSDVEIIVFGDEEGVAEVCADYGLRHEPCVERSESGLPYVSCMFARAQQVARHDFLCFSNCDIIFLPDFLPALEQVGRQHARFLIVGRRWNMEVEEAIDFSAADWAEKARGRALAENQQQPPWFIDYFAFSRGLFGSDLLPLLIGRAGWDNWMVWRGIASGSPVVDASDAVIAIHQNHDYRHHPGGRAGVYGGEEAIHNFRLAGGWKHMRTIADAPLILSANRLKSNWKRFGNAFKTNPTLPWYYDVLSVVWHPIWFFLLGVTRPLRSVLGLRSKSPPQRSEIIKK